jgi:hypothetical protein
MRGAPVRRPFAYGKTDHVMATEAPKALSGATY